MPQEAQEAQAVMLWLLCLLRFVTFESSGCGLRRVLGHGLRRVLGHGLQRVLGHGLQRFSDAGCRDSRTRVAARSPAAALPPDVRRGSASPSGPTELGLRPSYGLWPISMGLRFRDGAFETLAFFCAQPLSCGEGFSCFVCAAGAIVGPAEQRKGVGPGRI
jgi:hypothetical protein